MNSADKVSASVQTSFMDVWFDAPFVVATRDASPYPLPAGYVRLTHLCSSISAGTEMLAYRGQLPSELSLDATIEGFDKSASYPLRYGYAFVGVITALGEGVDDAWCGRRAFAFAPHGSYADVDVTTLIPIPDDITSEDASFLANMETAVNVLHDAKPLLGEHVMVFGQGIVGLLVTALLAHYPLASIRAVDRFSLRLNWARQLGAEAFSPEQLASESLDADLIIELTGVPNALNDAIHHAGYTSRIVIGSWYGNKSAPVYLGGAAHRNRLHMITSQVSTLAPELTGRWTKARRFEVTWDMIRRVKPSRFITHRSGLYDAAALYQQLDHAPDQVIQAVFVS
jgi:NADPH:quinone reductase-like Zn-dependent oxidoreductase